MEKMSTRTHEVYRKETVILYYGNGQTTVHQPHTQNAQTWAERAKRILGAQSYHLKS